jgi:L-ascorbate metabolism protein UlaG (beta-lactamase superfamily)
MNAWTMFEADGVRITAVPVKHFNGRYGFDVAWLDHHTYTGYVIEYQGKTVFFAGDTSSVQEGREVYPFVPPTQIFIG